MPSHFESFTLLVFNYTHITILLNDRLYAIQQFRKVLVECPFKQMHDSSIIAILPGNPYNLQLSPADLNLLVKLALATISLLLRNS